MCKCWLRGNMANFETDQVLVPPVSFVHDCIIEMKCDEIPGSRLTSSKNPRCHLEL
ncbi:predicted protein [Botrytis cinerea T4]|uniref:Uncharacterized protein n=1 Tax=Botryotinia fuckeliana (strain T4) TaxID=999810 RepID=G2YAC4_BOTF4|nr:predicted protein [Botrytis cinerea T4]